MVAAVQETPSKVAAAQFDKLDLTKPASINDKLVAESNKKSHKSGELVDQRQDRQGRDRFVGNPDITCDKDEPILKPNGKRFVLFPIQYHEVSSRKLVAEIDHTSRVYSRG